MSQRRRILFERPLIAPMVLVGKIFYDLGGMNFFTGRSEARGYYLSVYPETRTDGCRTVKAFSGTKLLLKAASRFQTQALARVTPTPEQIHQLTEHVLAKLSPEERPVPAPAPLASSEVPTSPGLAAHGVHL